MANRRRKARDPDAINTRVEDVVEPKRAAQKSPARGTFGTNPGDGETVTFDPAASVKKALEKAPEEKSKATPAEEKPERKLTPVALRVFITACGKKPDQTAGFAAYAQSRKYGPRTMPEWNRALAEFMTRPVK